MRKLIPALCAVLLAQPAWAEGRPSEDSMFGAPAADEPRKNDPDGKDSGRKQEPGEPKPDDPRAQDLARPPRDRPAESELFGAPGDEKKPEAGKQEAGAAPRKSEDDLFGSGAPPAAGADGSRQQVFGEKEGSVPEDPLKIGGQFYLRAQAGAKANTPPSQWTFNAPALVDGYFDARPNDRVRGFILARMSYDPTVTPTEATLFGPAVDGGPKIFLDQLWLRFDIRHAVFVTAGKQHMKLGTGRFWNPTDYLHNTRRDPLLVFDPRTGTNMVKLHFPWESKGWNFYALALYDNPVPASTVGQVGAALRAEVVLGTTEMGVDAVVVRGVKPRFGVDISTGLGDFDLYGEASLKSGKDVTLYRVTEDGSGVINGFEQYSPGSITLQATAGVTYSVNYGENDVLTLGGEVFYNQLGYDDAKLYPLLILNGAFTPFYTGRRYASLFALLPSPGKWDTSSFTLSNLANLSDASFITRLDYSLIVLTHLRFEAFSAVHYGNTGGEFRFGLDIPSRVINGTATPKVFVPAPAFEAGVGLRISI